MFALLYRTKMGSQRKLGIYVGYDSLYIVKYIEIQIRDVFKAQFVEYQFDNVSNIRGRK